MNLQYLPLTTCPCPSLPAPVAPLLPTGDGGAEHGGKTEKPAEAGEDPAVESTLHPGPGLRWWAERNAAPAGREEYYTCYTAKITNHGSALCPHSEVNFILCVFVLYQELAERYAPLLCLSVSEVGGALESIRVQAVKRGKGNRTFRETQVATLELLLPRDCSRVGERAWAGRGLWGWDHN